jgi:hypothetical protein
LFRVRLFAMMAHLSAISPGFVRQIIGGQSLHGKAGEPFAYVWSVKLLKMRRRRCLLAMPWTERESRMERRQVGVIKELFRYPVRLLLDSRVVNVPRSYHPTSVTLSFSNPFFFNGLQKV